MADEQDRTKAEPAKFWTPATGCGFFSVAVFCVCVSMLGIRSCTGWTHREYVYVPADAPHGAHSLEIGEEGRGVGVTAYYLPRLSEFRVIVDEPERDSAQPAGTDFRPTEIVITDHLGRRSRARASGWRTEHPVVAGPLAIPPLFGRPSPEYHLTLEVTYELNGSHTVRSGKLFPRRGERHRRMCASAGEGIFLLIVLALTFAGGMIAFPFLWAVLMQWRHGPGEPPAVTPTEGDASGDE